MEIEITGQVIDSIAHSNSSTSRFLAKAWNDGWGKWFLVVLAGVLGGFFGFQQGLNLSSAGFFGIFLGTVAGLVVNPVPAQQIVLTSVLLVALSGILPIEKALSGYADPIVWLVLAACLLSRCMIKTGLGKRISLH